MSSALEDPHAKYRFPYRNVIAGATAFFRVFGHWPNVYEPATYGEKIFWRKLFDRNPAFPRYVDKLQARAVVEERGCAELLKPLLLASLDRDEAVSIAAPGMFVSMSNASRRNARVTTDGGLPDHNTLKNWQEQVYGYSALEWAYLPNAHLNHYLLEPDFGPDLLDIKVYCFAGEPVFGYVARENPTRIVVIDRRGDRLSLRNRYPVLQDYGEAIPHIRQAFDAAAELSKGFDHIRVDFLVTPIGLRFGEFTLYPSSGLNPWIGVESLIGAFWRLDRANAIPYPEGATPYA
jgi:hypothetical protein